MSCLKCGRDTEEHQVFCEDCLARMEECPVPPGTVVVLPSRRREAAAPKRAPKRRAPTPEERIKSLRLRLRILTAVLVLALTASAVLAVPAWRYLSGAYHRKGQNYSVVTPSSQTTRPGTSRRVP